MRNGKLKNFRLKQDVINVHMRLLQYHNSIIMALSLTSECFSHTISSVFIIVRSALSQHSVANMQVNGFGCLLACICIHSYYTFIYGR